MKYNNSSNLRMIGSGVKCGSNWSWVDFARVLQLGNGDAESMLRLSQCSEVEYLVLGCGLAALEG